MRWKALARERLSVAHIGLFAVILGFLCVMFNMSPHGSAPVQVAQSSGRPERWHGLPDYNSDPDAGAKMVDQLCRKANGDVSKLSTEEMKWLDAISAGNGANMVLAKAEQYREEQASERRHRPAKAPGKSHRSADAHEPVVR